MVRGAICWSYGRMLGNITISNEQLQQQGRLIVVPWRPALAGRFSAGGLLRRLACIFRGRQSAPSAALIAWLRCVITCEGHSRPIDVRGMFGVLFGRLSKNLVESYLATEVSSLRNQVEDLRMNLAALDFGLQGRGRRSVGPRARADRRVHSPAGFHLVRKTVTPDCPAIYMLRVQPEVQTGY